METPKEIRSALEYWRTTNIQVNSGASPEEINAVEKALGLKMPDALRLLYQEANGMPKGGEDHQLFSFWPLERIAPAADAWGVPAGAPFILFGDFLIGSHAYGVLCEGPAAGSVHVFAGREFEKIADSVESFFASVVSDPDRGPTWMTPDALKANDGAV